MGTSAFIHAYEPTRVNVSRLMGLPFQALPTSKHTVTPRECDVPLYRHTGSFGTDTDGGISQQGCSDGEQAANQREDCFLDMIIQVLITQPDVT